MDGLAGGALVGGRYRLGKQIAATGHSELFVAADERLGRTVTLKFLTDPGPEAAERALQEARVLAEVSHPNVVAIYDIAEDLEVRPGLRYIVLEHVPGRDLKARIAEQGSLSLPAFFRLAADLASALDAVHRRGIVHRDVKPQNVVVADDGPAKLVDFGIALPQNVAETAVEGTLDYLSPERLRGEPASVAGDVYGLGATLYEALTGWPPYPPARSPEEALAWRAQPPPSPSTHRHALPADLDAVLLRALHPDPRERQPSAAILAAELDVVWRRHLQETGVIPISVQRTASPPPDLRGATRHTAMLLGFLALALVGLVTLVATLATRGLNPGLDSGGTARAAMAASTITPRSQASTAPTQLPTASPPTSTPTPVRIVVPSLVGLPRSVAEETARKEGFRIEQVGEEETEAKPPGTVTRQEPKAGERVVAGTSLRLTVAKLPSTTVPNVVGRPYEEARRQLEAARLVVSSVDLEQTDDVKPGTVLRQSLAAGQRLPVGTRIDLRVAAEPLATVPNVVGRTFDDARALLEQAKLKVGDVESRRVFSLRETRVIAQAPEAGIQLKRGSEVDLVVELGLLSGELKKKGRGR